MKSSENTTLVGAAALCAVAATGSATAMDKVLNSPAINQNRERIAKSPWRHEGRAGSPYRAIESFGSSIYFRKSIDPRKSVVYSIAVAPTGRHFREVQCRRGQPNPPLFRL